ncbi:hypothetical protein [Roseinatronobacter sp.]|uniref:hypothetical protein n=1 Tax=Roseinatronobacter sp. TaxID=1945755 RepID=UPI0025E53DE3|nr:hypothetical protein [Roseibaca sp.]
MQSLAWFQEYQSRIQYLPWTVEVGIYIEYIQKRQEFISKMKEYLNEPQICWGAHITDPSDPKNRKECKKWVRETIEFWNASFNIGKKKIKEALCSYLATLYFQENKPEAMQKISPLIS